MNNKGYITFEYAEDYLAYQDKLIKNWKDHPNGCIIFNHSLHRGTGRTYAALTAAVQFAERGIETAFIYAPYSIARGNEFKYHPVYEFYKDEVANGKLHLLTVDGFLHHLPKYTHCILDHTVFEMYKPSQLDIILNPPAKQEIKYFKEIRKSPNSFSSVKTSAKNISYEVNGDTLEVTLEYE